MRAREILRQNVRRLRKLRGFKAQKELAEVANLSTGVIGRVESKQGSFPDELTISKLAEALGCEESDLFAQVDMMSEKLHLSRLAACESQIVALRAYLEAAEKRYNQVIGVDQPMPEQLPGLRPDRREAFAILAELKDFQFSVALDILRELPRNVTVFDKLTKSDM